MTDGRSSQPQYSADGRWWWTGAEWIPTPPRDVRRTSTPTTLVVGIASVIVVISLVSAIGLAAALQPTTVGNGSITSHSTPMPNTQSTPRPAQVSTAAQAARPANSVKLVRPSQPVLPERSAGGEFSIALPAGWIINPSQDGATFTITPQGAAEPRIGVFAALPVSDLRAKAVAEYCAQNGGDALSCSQAELGYQLTDSQRKWSADASLSALTQFLTATQKVQFGSPQMTELSSTSAAYAVAQRAGGVSLQDWGVIAMGYVNSPFQLSATIRAFTSLALVTSCEAVADQAVSMQSICKQALSSFRPSQMWLQHLAARQLQSYQNEFQIIRLQLQNEQQFQQMIQSFSSKMQQMQVDEFKAMEEADAKVNDGWYAALGGEVNMQDPSDQRIYLLDAGFSNYCMSKLNVAIESNGALQPGATYGGETCASIMNSIA
jgi:hypothetical protein